MSIANLQFGGSRLIGSNNINLISNVNITLDSSYNGTNLFINSNANSNVIMPHSNTLLNGFAVNLYQMGSNAQSVVVQGEDNVFSPSTAKTPKQYGSASVVYDGEGVFLVTQGYFS